MCGISGVAGYEDISATLVESIKQLEYRGYDSCGVAILNGGGDVCIKKNIGGVEEVAAKEQFLALSGNTGIAHTRWATHGKVTVENTHPHASCDSDFVLVHNGIISNYIELKEELIKKGHRFVSKTDTEVIVHLVEQEYKTIRDTEKALISALKKLTGTYAVVIVSVYEPGKIFCAKHESPLVIGIGDEENYVGSDVTAFINYTKNTIILDDRELAIVTRDSYFVRNFLTGDEVDKDIVKLTWDTEMTKKGGYPHFMLKEIYEQPQTIKNVLKI
ncbi:MAG: class II glutamine amidotransferase, partial [Nitrospinota bacterium]